MKLPLYLGLDSLHYLSLEGLVKATGMAKKNFCLACFDGKYPVAAGSYFSQGRIRLKSVILP